MAEIIDNLGGYGQFTSAANSLIRSLEKTAVSNAAPGLRAQGGQFLGYLAHAVCWAPSADCITGTIKANKRRALPKKQLETNSAPL